MSTALQNVIVLSLVAAALLYLGLVARRTFVGKKGSCGCGKAACGKLATLPQKGQPGKAR